MSNNENDRENSRRYSESTNNARNADLYLAESNLAETYRIKFEHAPKSELFKHVNKTVIYVGCGRELSPLFLFENASRYIHQDIYDPNLQPALHILEEKGIVENYNTSQSDINKRIHTFQYQQKEKELIEIVGTARERRQTRAERLINPGDIGNFVPVEAKSDLQVIYFFGMPYPDSIKARQINLLPYLEIGGMFVGAYPYNNGSFEGAPPQELGLVETRNTYVKTKQLSAEDIQRIISYTLHDYKLRQ